MSDKKSRVEEILKAMLGEVAEIKTPQSRVEVLLLKLKDIIEGSGGIGNSYSKEEIDTKLSDKASLEDVADEIARIIDDAPEDFDTLKEISNWIYNHQDSAAAMNLQINQNGSNIENLSENIKNNYVKNTDYATNEKAGIGIVNSGYGIFMGGTNKDYMRIQKASDSEIARETQEFRPIVPSSIGFMMSNYGITSKTTIEEMQENINSLKIKSAAITGEITSKSGVRLNGFNVQEHIIISAYTTTHTTNNTDIVLTPYKTVDGEWAVNCMSTGAGTLPEGEIDVIFFYIDRAAIAD